VNFLGWVITGLIAGSLAQRVTGLHKRGCLFTLLVGVVGGVLGGILFNAAGSRGMTDFSLWSLLVAFAGASILCWVLAALETRGTQHPRRR
jgi:uncharacterized membrane protein YeaQ/YmgE (transglycosylase-associated protein family)